MKADTRTVGIHTSVERAVDFLADPTNLPRWAVGFAKDVRRDHDRWIVSTGSGEMAVRVVADRASGVVDFFLSPSPGIEVLAASRVVAAGEGVEYVFTQFQSPGMPDDVFARNVQALTRELTVLKALLEIECPL